MLDAFGDYLRELEGRGCRVILQAAGHSHEEYIAAVEKIEELAPWCSGIELNISCPNIARGGALVGGTRSRPPRSSRRCAIAFTGPSW